ncbi:MAG TPA: cation:proton antiporter [Thauera sp.]|uniref:cation:proton antiporter n=1 Tax=Thauera sp. TaxID=1905334 RepID=UPI002BE42E3B|nr:cation:proton antiporter family protein [Thauera sp.]HRP24863.1 cation:proton antiporter [Thauera sp.]HRP65535.1 cation:proton antiporter [Thauera sp.]
MEQMLAHGPYAEFALLLIISAVAGAIAVRLRQPVLIAYIVVGILVGPAVFGIVQAHEQIALLAEIGVTVLLFVVGLKLDLHHIRHIGPVALATGLGQLAFTIVFGFVLILLMGKDVMEAIYVAVALTFSSTIIIVKLLSDKRELDSLHGRIAVGFLIVQDVAVVLAMMAMSALRGAGDAGVVDVAGSLVLRLVAAAVLMFVLMRYVLPRLVEAMARSQELLLIFAIAWGTGLAAIGEWAGFSKEAGAFMAGFSLASTSYREAMNARLTGIRDFMLLFFFIDLGSKLDFSTLGGEIWPAVVLSVFVLIGNPLIVMAIMGYMGYRKRTGFLAGLTVAQISEFSIVFVAMGITLGHVGVEALGLTTLVGLVTIMMSTYMILFSHALYDKLAPWLGVFERKRPFRELAVERPGRPAGQPDIIIFGLGRYGSRLMSQLRAAGIEVLGVDFDPETVRALRKLRQPVRFGDGEDPSFLESLPLEHARWAITTFPQWESNRAFLNALKEAGFRGRIAGVVRDDLHGEALDAAGVERVLNPFTDAADYAARAFAAEIAFEQVHRQDGRAPDAPARPEADAAALDPAAADAADAAVAAAQSKQGA